MKISSRRYLELITAFPPCPVGCDAEFELVQEQVNQILDGGPLGADEQEYLRLLGILIYDYEECHEPAFIGE